MNQSDFTKKKINFLSSEPEQHAHAEQIDHPHQTHHPRQNNKRKKISYFFIFAIIILSILARSLAAGNNGFLSGIKNSYLLRQIINIVSPSEKYLDGEKEDRINFLLTGMGGPGHNGPYLTDTIILVNFKPSTKQASFISLPRDMIVPVGPNNYQKINSIYTIGKQKDDQGAEYLKEIVSKTFDIPVHYYVNVDFQGFVEIIDAIGGVKVTVDSSFTDYQFPTEDYKYQEVSFKAGEQKMDGLTALRFARSRHGNNGEGSDFARSKRQQKILTAMKEKIVSFNTLVNPKKITALFSLLNQYTQTNLEPWEAVKLVHMAKGLKNEDIISQSIDDRPGGFLKSGISMDGAYILQPVSGNFQAIQQLIKNILHAKDVNSENPKIVIQNGTPMPGLALQAVNYLEYMGYKVLKYGNAEKQDKISTVIYEYTKDKEQTKKMLESVFNTKIEKNIPLEYLNSVVVKNWQIKDENNNDAQLDFLIILGSDQIIDASAQIVPTMDPNALTSSTASTTSSTIEILNP